jgi:hypothetical protein
MKHIIISLLDLLDSPTKNISEEVEDVHEVNSFPFEEENQHRDVTLKHRLRTTITIYPVMCCLFSYLKPWDIAKLCYIFKIRLSMKQRDRYLNLVDDIFVDKTILEVARRKNLRITVFGLALEKMEMRLKKTSQYFQNNGEDCEEVLPRLFIAISGIHGSGSTKVSKYIYDLPYDSVYETASEDDKLLTQWMRVEPFCSNAYEERGLEKFSPTHRESYLAACTVSPLWTFQNSYWWDPLSSECIPSVYESVDRYSSGSTAQLVAYVADGLWTRQRSIDITSKFVPYVARFSGSTYTVFHGQIEDGRLEVHALQDEIPRVRPTKISNFVNVYREEVVIGLALGPYNRLDIMLHPTMAGTVALW